MVKKLFATVIFCSVAIAVDLVSKEYFFTHPEHLGPLTSFLSLTLVKNKGITFGLAQGYLGPIIFANVILLIGTFFIALNQERTFLRYLWLLIFSGGIANLYDRILLGYVRDFIHLHYQSWSWPVFNIADCMISLAVVALLYYYSQQTSSNS